MIGRFKPRRLRDKGKTLSMLCAGLIILLVGLIIVFISMRGLSTFFVTGIRPVDFLFGSVWKPDRPAAEGGPLVGVLPFFLGSVFVSMCAVLISTPLSFATAIFMQEISPSFGERILRPATELFVGIPSVVYGWIGVSALVPLIRNNVGGHGFSVLAGAIVLSIMILPTITSISADSLKSLPRELKEAAYALGSTRWQTIRYVLFPAALPRSLTGVVLGLARAIGEALAVQMVIGNTRLIPTSLLSPAITLTSGITMDMGYTIPGSLWNNALWSMALLLLLLTLLFIVLIHRLGKGEFGR